VTTLKRFKRIAGQTIEKRCIHPEDKRIDARSMGHPDRYICGVCGARLGDWTEER
jgi:hypothetical protein